MVLKLLNIIINTIQTQIKQLVLLRMKMMMMICLDLRKVWINNGKYNIKLIFNFYSLVIIYVVPTFETKFWLVVCRGLH